MKELVVVAIGGNSIIKDNASQSIEHQAEAVKAVADMVLEMLASDYDIVLTHGNGPQVGLDLRRAEIAHEREGLPLTPLANCVADTQGGIGYLIQQALNNRLARHGEKKAVTVVTQVEVDKNDPGFAHPTKPIGAFFSESQRDKLQKANPDWCFVEDAGRGYRRVVASPEPKRIVEAPAIKALIQQGFVVIGAGGGGIPVVRTEAGDYQSVDAVIDKDLSTALLAREIHADILVITTDVEKVCIHFGKPQQQALDRVDIATMTRYMHETTPSGVAAINYMVETVEKTPQLKGKLTISHAFALATLNEQQVDALANRMAAQQISIASTVPIGTLHMPLKQLHDKGVKVMTGTDSVIDHWSPYGLGDMLEKANLYAQLYIRPNEQNLSRSLFLATGDVLPLNEKGERVWPKAQDDASFVLVDASCSAEAVARISPRTATFHKGQLVWGSVAG